MLVLVVMLLGACAPEPAAELTQDNSGSSNISAGLLIIAAGERPPAPLLAGDALGGGTVGLADFAGRVIVLNTIASWCTPCQEELPVLVAAVRAHPEAQFVGLDVEDYDEAAVGFLAAGQATYPIIKDPTGSLLGEFTMNPNRGLPVTFFIDSQGRLAGRILGKVTAASLELALARMR